MKIIVVGNGMVGYKFCEKIRKKENAQHYEITVYGEEHRPAYDRVHLSEYFAGKTADDLLMAPKEWYAANQINLITGELVTSIDPIKKTVITHKGTIDTYDKLILATGSSPFMPPLHGIDKVGVFAYRTIEDLQQMAEFGRTAKKAIVIGGGLLGLEAAKALLDMQLETHVVEFADRLMPRQLDARGATILKDKLTSLGLHIHTSKSTKEVLGDNKISGLSFADGSVLDCDMLVVSAGIRPRDELAKNSGISIGSRGGIEVNNKLQTNYPDIFAIGEVALHQEMIYGLVAPGYEMAEVVATLLCGDNQASFNGFDMSTKLKLIGVDVASFGDALDMDEECVPIVYENKAKGIYKRINITRDGKYLKGGILVGEADAYNMLLQITQNGLSLPEDPADLILGARGANQSASGQGVEALPDTAQICSCEGITKGGICEAIEVNELTDLAGVKKVTKACTGCGGCTPMVADLLKSVLESQGKQIKKTVCEHFGYSRQELYDLIRVNDIKSYDELLGRYGQGDGCETCKPIVASLLASIWNEVILKQSTIQDTNDRFLANIQKGGSYSVVPRIPAGEITPDKLLVIAQVAKKYQLYTKITGGQRIDLFGAQLHELPAIWEELIAAGFESGHAYGKSLRTIKSCVGSTWCRFGVQDSVGFAIEIENRYKGLRSPHKLKGAVSGCIRECAEAQSKDFGIIATDKGWNLYVCGNGGARPQHALLLVGDVDKESCIRYLDRFLMYYIKTAEPLTRTATWLNKMEGGLTYLYDVVVNDILGIGKQLEEEMETLIANYECEWKHAVENESFRKRFSHFANSEEGDPYIKFQEVRGQKMPVEWGSVV
jgi:nitrite reductase (NADH) large subunit